MPSDLSTSLQYLKGVGPKLAETFAKRGLFTFEDALYYLPRTFEDRRQPTPIIRLVPGLKAVVRGKVVDSKWTGGRGRRQFEATLKDASGKPLTLHWFHTVPSLKDEFVLGREVTVYGEIHFFRGRLQMNHPDFAGGEVISPEFSGVLPVYTSPENLSQKVVRKVVRGAVESSMPLIQEPLPGAMLERLGLCDLKTALKMHHFPETVPDAPTLRRALDRLIFEEFFVFQLGLLLNRERRALAPVMQDSSGVNELVKSLPFALTGDQERAISEITRDLGLPLPMTRLLQGDVGSGKTVVSLAAAVMAARSGYQTALMVPTEVLAIQHFQKARELLKELFPVLLVHGAEKMVSEKVASGESKLVIGTHALFQEAVRFHRLGLVIVDEQHRFGVRQRRELIDKAAGVPHLLMMTATPIPRTLSLTLYGDLDLTIIREKPKARLPIRTRMIFERDRETLYGAIRKRIEAREQIYVVYPLVEESEKLDLKSAIGMFEELKKVFQGASVELVHGRMASEEKERVLDGFRRGAVSVLVATTVVEVGIDVPNATLMVIEHAERLGLSQLHQLRGRVGRGTKASECFLVSKVPTQRLRILVQSDDGFVIAEEDLKLRGAGEFLGTRQSGGTGFRLGDIVRDGRLLNTAHEEASRLLVEDPGLEKPEHKILKKMVETRWKEKQDFVTGG
ncbi:MAG: ATP-dependent DNA helicase RecG [Deltaproteobacteria bacterium]|nr:ATP-dependent DNA helicase RecG [Deltaproteobacteria bacterium]MBI3294911.1 ATP-dependent DNA helicase RecG [Deltaproteobacteria bacterium]